MSVEDKLDQAKGAVKEGFGKLVGDAKTEAEGAAEKAAAKVKEVAENASENVKEVAENAKGAVEGAIDGVKNIFGKDKE